MDGKVTPFSHPVTHKILIWDEVSTWWCFDCLEEADNYCELDGFVRCADCAAIWNEHHLDYDGEGPPVGSPSRIAQARLEPVSTALS